jgi:hypothetical protein
MKIAVKAKPEPLEQLNIRVPASLKQQMEATRKLADECNADYNATLIGVLANFNANLQAQLSKSRSKSASGNPSKTATAADQKFSDGSVSNASVR